MYDYRQMIKVILQNTQGTPSSLLNNADTIQEILDYSRQIDPQHIEKLQDYLTKHNNSKPSITDMQELIKLTQEIDPKQLTLYQKLQEIQTNLPKLKPQLNSSIATPNGKTRIKPAPKSYFIQRQLNGATLINNFGTIIRKYPEQIVRDFNLQNNDEVALKTPIKTNNFEIDHVIAHHDHINHQLVTDPIVEFKYGQVKYDAQSNDYYVEKNYQEPLATVNSAIDQAYYIPQAMAKNLDLHIDDLVDLAWFENHPEKVLIRWKHTDNTLPDPTPAPKKHSEYATKETNTPTYTDTDPRQLDFDLKGSAVAIIVGDKQRENEFTNLITAHNGKAVIIDAFYHQSDIFYHFTTKLAGCKYAILVQNYNKHATSKAIRDIVAKTNIGFAIANSMGLNDVERAIYRAIDGDPAYEASNSDVQYPILKK